MDSYFKLEKLLKERFFDSRDYTEFGRYDSMGDWRRERLTQIVYNIKSLNDQEVVCLVKFIFTNFKDESVNSSIHTDCPHWYLLKEISKNHKLALETWIRQMKREKNWLMSLPKSSQEEIWNVFASCFRFLTGDRTIINSFKNLLREIGLDEKLSSVVMASLFKWDRDWVFENLITICNASKNIIGLMLFFIQKHKEEKEKWLNELLKIYSAKEILSCLEKDQYLKRNITDWEKLLND